MSPAAPSAALTVAGGPPPARTGLTFEWKSGASPARVRSHPTFRKGGRVRVFTIAGRPVADGTWLFDPRNSEFGCSLSDRQKLSFPEASEFEEWDPDPEWSARVNAGLEELRPEWDPWDHLEESELSEDGQALDDDGCTWGTADLLPLEAVVSLPDSARLTPEDTEWLRGDLELQHAALPLYDLSAEVITEESEHPFSTLTCDNCGDQSAVRLDHCGRALCIPCWRKESHRSFPEVGRTLATFLKIADPHLPLLGECRRAGHKHDERRPDLRELAARFRGLGVRPIVRFVTLTTRSGSNLEERLRTLLDAWARLREVRFFRDRSLGEIAKIEVTWSEGGGWHVHLHLAEIGRFLRDRPYGPFEEPRLVPRPRPLKHVPTFEQLPEYYRFAFSGGAPSYLREFEPESDLETEWIRATRGDGSIVDVRTADLHDDTGAFALELSKYIAKPFAGSAEGSTLELKDWPESVRLELARFVRGSTRVRWCCPQHRTGDRPSTRRRAPWDPAAVGGCPPDSTECVSEDGREGEYRVESVGARRLRYYGSLRVIHAEVRDDAPVELEEHRCGKCGKGSLLAPWEVARRILSGWHLPPGATWPLPSIRVHKSRVRSGGARPFDGSPWWSGQAGRGAEGPPPHSGFDLALEEEGLRQ